MSEFFDEDEQAYDDQMSEVEVDDSAPVDDESVAGQEIPDNVDEVTPAVDLAFVAFAAHSDSVYCSAVHPLIPGLVITGESATGFCLAL